MTMAIVALYLFIQMSIFWAIAIRIKNPSLVDVAWAIGITVAAGIYLFSSETTTRNVLIFSLACIWCVRLSGYIYLTRIAKGHVDKRYITLSQAWKIKRSLGYYLNFQLQAFLSWIIAIVFIFPGQSTQLTLSPIDAICAIIVIAGITGESIADWQLFNFRRSKNPTVCNIGLWHYSRHPNYFFEWLVWLGFFAFAMRSTYGCFAVISPALLYYIFNYITGPMTERGSLQSRGDAFKKYMQTTPMFWPRIIGRK